MSSSYLCCSYWFSQSQFLLWPTNSVTPCLSYVILCKACNPHPGVYHKPVSGHLVKQARGHISETETWCCFTCSKDKTEIGAQESARASNWKSIFLPTSAHLLHSHPHCKTHMGIWESETIHSSIHLHEAKCPWMTSPHFYHNLIDSI